MYSHGTYGSLPEVPPAVLDIARSTLALSLPEDELATEDTLYMCDNVCKCLKLLKILHVSYFDRSNCEVLRTFWLDALRWLTYLHANAASYDHERRYKYVVGLSAILHSMRGKPRDHNSHGVHLHHEKSLDEELEDNFFSLICKVWPNPNLRKGSTYRPSFFPIIDKLSSGRPARRLRSSRRHRGSCPSNTTKVGEGHNAVQTNH